MLQQDADIIALKFKYQRLAKSNLNLWKEAKKYYLQSKQNLASTTLYSYKHTIEVFEDFYASCYEDKKRISFVSEIEREHFTAFLDYAQLRYKRKDGTISNKQLIKIIQILKSFFHWLKASEVKGEYVYFIDLLKVPKNNKSIVRRHTLVLSPDEAKKMLQELLNLTLTAQKYKHSNPKRYRHYKQIYVVICFLATYGMRLSEISNITMDKVTKSLDGKSTILDLRIKGGRQLPLKIHPHMGKMLEEHIDEFCKGGSKNDYVFYNLSRTKPMPSKKTWHMVKNLAKKIGITRKITPHSFRATLATYMDISGHPIGDIQKQLGHASPEMTRKYIDSLRVVDATKYDLFKAIGINSEKFTQIPYSESQKQPL